MFFALWIFFLFGKKTSQLENPEISLLSNRISTWTGCLNILLYFFLDGFLPLFVPPYPVSKPLSLLHWVCALLAFPTNWHGKRGLTQAASGGVNFLQSHFILYIAAMPAAQAESVKRGSRISPLPLEECSALQHTAQRCLFGRMSSGYGEEKYGA